VHYFIPEGVALSGKECKSLGEVINCNHIKKSQLPKISFLSGSLCFGAM